VPERMRHAVPYLLAFIYGLSGAAAWAWWATAVANKSPTQAAVADIVLIGLSAANINFIAQRRFREFVSYTLAAAFGTWVMVFLSQ
jgi:hypothetical protein